MVNVSCKTEAISPPLETFRRSSGSEIVPAGTDLQARCRAVKSANLQRKLAAQPKQHRQRGVDCAFRRIRDLHAWETGSLAKAGVGRWITFYNHQRPHAAHGGQPSAVVYFNSIETDQQVQAVA